MSEVPAILSLRRRLEVVVAKVEWSRTPGEDVEAALGVMLCRENPKAVRRRPSQGDKGVDIYIPGDDGWTIYQVKRFTGSLTPSQKRQITHSFEELYKYVTEEGIRVREWILIRPENPTEQDDKWLTLVTGQAAFACGWQGLDHCDRLAADHASVVDYYFRDGKDRLRATLKDLMSAFDAVDRVGDLTTPAASGSGLESIHKSINALDPHFRYDFAVQAVLDGKLPQPTDAPLLIAAVTRADSGRAVTHYIYGRYEDATADRPVPGHFTIKVEPGSVDEKALREFLDYGLPFSGIDVSDMTFDLPGGFGGTQKEGTLSLGPARTVRMPQAEFQLVVYGPDATTELASVDVIEPITTTGQTGLKFATTGRERHGVFTTVFKVDIDTGRLNVSLTPGDLTGTEPADVLPGLRFMEALKPPNLFALRLRNGPLLEPPQVVPTSIGDDATRIIRVCEALALIQRHTVLPVRVPDLDQLKVEQAHEWLRVARLLRGEAVEQTWTRVGVELHPGTDRPGGVGDAFTIAVPRALSVEVGGVDIPLGQEITQLMKAKIDEGSLRPGHVEFVPAGDARAVSRWAGQL